MTPKEQQQPREGDERKFQPVDSEGTELREYFRSIVHNIEHLNQEAALNTARAGVKECDRVALRAAGQQEQPRETQIRLDEARWWADGEHGAHNLQILLMSSDGKTCARCERIVKLEAALAALRHRRQRRRNDFG